jgi:hypothetical protein
MFPLLSALYVFLNKCSLAIFAAIRRPYAIPNFFDTCAGI